MESGRGSFSPDGTKVVFESRADNLVSDDDLYGARDIFVKDLQTGAIELISRTNALGNAPGNGHSERPHFSGDGKKVIFISAASDLVANDTNDSQDVFIRNLETDTTTRVSVTANGTQGNNDSWDCAISPDGTKVVFVTDATNFGGGADNNQSGDVFLKDLVTGSVTRLSTIANEAFEGSRLPRFSPDGGVIIWHTMVKVNATDYQEEYFTYVLPGPINGTSGNDTKNGTPRPDTINGLAGNDTLNGLGASDTLNGGPGNDTMKGGAGNDTYIVNSAGDVVDESVAGSSGTDTVQSSVTFSLANTHSAKGPIEHLTLTGAGAINGTGNALEQHHHRQRCRQCPRRRCAAPTR